MTDVVWSCSPGPDEGRAFPVNVSALLGLPAGPLACLSPLPFGEGEEGRGWGVASGPDLWSPVPRLGVSSGAVGLRTQADALASPSWRVPRAALRGGEGCAAAMPRPYVGVWACLVGPSAAPPECSRLSLRCLRPSGGVLFPWPCVLLGSPPRRCVCVPWVALFDRGSRRWEKHCVLPSWRLTGEALRGRGAGSAPALAAHTLLGGRPLTHAAEPSRPAEDWRLLVCLRGPEGEMIGRGTGRPRWERLLWRSEREPWGTGAPATAPPGCAVTTWRRPEPVGRDPPPLRGEGAMGAPAAVGPCAACHLKKKKWVTHLNVQWKTIKLFS